MKMKHTHTDTHRHAQNGTFIKSIISTVHSYCFSNAIVVSQPAENAARVTYYLLVTSFISEAGSYFHAVRIRSPQHVVCTEIPELSRFKLSHRSQYPIY